MKFKNKISIISLLNDLGINKVPKENKNKEKILSKILGNYYFEQKEYHFEYGNIQNSI
jgi:hypothetical protein